MTDRMLGLTLVYTHRGLHEWARRLTETFLTDTGRLARREAERRGWA